MNLVYLAMVTGPRSIAVDTAMMLQDRRWEKGLTMAGYQQLPRQMSMGCSNLGQAYVVFKLSIYGNHHLRHLSTLSREMMGRLYPNKSYRPPQLVGISQLSLSKEGDKTLHRR